MDTADAWSQLARSRFVTLGTRRRSGVVVQTPVWVAPDGADLVVTTDRRTGKAKRIRNFSAVTVQRCNVAGKVAPDSTPVSAVATLDSDPAQGTAALAAKYGVQFRIYSGVEHFIGWVRRKPGDTVIIRIRPEA